MKIVIDNDRYRTLGEAEENNGISAENQYIVNQITNINEQIYKAYKNFYEYEEKLLHYQFEIDRLTKILKYLENIHEYSKNS